MHLLRTHAHPESRARRGCAIQMTGSAQGDIVKAKRRPTFWMVATFSLLAILVTWVLWIALAPQAIRLARPGGGNGKPSVSEVEDGMRTSSARQGTVEDVKCHLEKVDVWSCTVGFAGGQVNLTKAVWYPSQRSLGISVVHRSPG